MKAQSVVNAPRPGLEIHEAAFVLRCCEAEVLRRVDAGSLAAVRLYRRVLITPESIDRVLRDAGDALGREFLDRIRIGQLTQVPKAISVNELPPSVYDLLEEL